MTITFSAPVTGFTLADLQLSANGSTNLLTSAETLTTVDNITWTLGNLAGVTDTSGSYALILSGAGIQDGAGNTLAAEVTAGFTVDTMPPTVAIVPVSPSPRNSDVTSMTITFSEPVTGFALASLQLSLNGGANLLTAAQTLTTVDSTTWTLGNLAALTAAGGNYSLTLSSAGIADLAGNALASGAVSTFELRVWQNTASRFDVNANGIINPLDALIVINYLNTNGPGALPASYTGPYYLDVNGDGLVSPLDALGVINYLNAQTAANAVSTPAAGGAIVQNAATTATPVLGPPAATASGGAAGIRMKSWRRESRSPHRVRTRPASSGLVHRPRARRRPARGCLRPALPLPLQPAGNRPWAAGRSIGPRWIPALPRAVRASVAATPIRPQSTRPWSRAGIGSWRRILAARSCPDWQGPINGVWSKY